MRCHDSYVSACAVNEVLQHCKLFLRDGLYWRWLLGLNRCVTIIIFCW